MKSKTQEHFSTKSLKTHYFKGFSRTAYNSRTIQGIQGIQEPLTTLFFLPFHAFRFQKTNRNGIIYDVMNWPA